MVESGYVTPFLSALLSLICIEILAKTGAVVPEAIPPESDASNETAPVEVLTFGLQLVPTTPSSLLSG